VIFIIPHPSLPGLKKNEKVIPARFRGAYLSAEDGVLNNMQHGNGKGVTVKISEKRIYIDEESDYHLSDSVILRKFKHDYFLNIFDREKNVWNVILIKEIRDKIHYYMIPSEESPKMARLKEITTVGKFDSNEKEFIINPTQKEFLKILESDIFAPMDTLTRIE
jgi:hypothetical protein